MRRSLSVLLSVLVLILLMTDTASAGRHRSRKKKPVKKVNIYDVDTVLSPIPRNRQIFHMYVDDEQHKADATDGKIDNMIYYDDDSLFTHILTQSILRDVDHMQVMIENLPTTGNAFTDNQSKILFLQAIREMLMKFNRDVKVDPYYYKRLVRNMHDMIIAYHENKMDSFVRKHVNIYTLENGNRMLENYPAARAYLYKTLGKQDPKMMIQRLADYADEPFAPDIIADAARVIPSEVFNFASSTNYKLRNAVRNCQDPLVQTIVKIADHSNSPLKAMPFLTDIYNKKLTIAEVDAIAADPDLYYKNLVRLKLENNSLGDATYTDELAYRGLRYVRDMDDLHESPDPIRFKCLENLSPEAMYFIMVYGQDEIYTSSFLGTFKRMLDKMQPMTGADLLDSVHHDHFRTFIRMCAGYNTLSQFLGTMSEEKKNKLMKQFIAGLDKGKDNDLEDAVDVADAFGSIRDTGLANFLQNEVKKNYEASYRERSKKGVIIYGLLATLFQGAKSIDDEDLAAKQSQLLQIPPINFVPYKKLLGDTDKVFEQYFFYGDEDGKNSYASFLGDFKDGKWKIVTDKYWSVISSTEGKPVVIYANLPIPEPGDEDAQNRLCAYLDSNNIHPTIIVHRGHSYHLPLTLDKLSKNTKIVMLGSCGGYHNLSIVLDHSPDAHIISSKQTGAMAVNEPIIKALNAQLLQGNDINWIKMWRGLNQYFDKKKDLKDKFSDYVPPYKNLGAIFIKAYRRILNTEAS